MILWSEWATRRTAEGVPYEWLCQNGGTDQEDNLKAALVFEDGALKVEATGGKRDGRSYWTEGKKNLENTDEK